MTIRWRSVPNLKRPGQEAVICSICDIRIPVDEDVILNMDAHVERCEEDA